MGIKIYWMKRMVQTAHKKNYWAINCHTPSTVTFYTLLI